MTDWELQIEQLASRPEDTVCVVVRCDRELCPEERVMIIGEVQSVIDRGPHKGIPVLVADRSISFDLMTIDQIKETVS